MITYYQICAKVCILYDYVLNVVLLRWIMSYFNILHLSDLHIKINNSPILDTMFSLIIDDIIKVQKEQDNLTKIDAIFFTGDLVNRGQSEEFDELNQQLICLSKMLTKKNLGKDILLFPTPGNHDLVRDENALQKFANGVDEEGKIKYTLPDFESHELALKPLDKCFDAYTDWFDKLDDTGFKRPKSITQGLLPGEYKWLSRDYDIQIISMNTAYKHISSDSKGRLELSNQQFRILSAHLPENYNHKLTIFLTHHPEDWLMKADNENHSYFNQFKHSFVHLHGHMHEFHANKISSIGDKFAYRAIQAGALNENDKDAKKFRYYYSILHFDLTNDYPLWTIYPREGKLDLQGKLYFERYTDANNKKGVFGPEVVRLQHYDPPKTQQFTRGKPSGKNCSILKAEVEKQLSDHELLKYINEICVNEKKYEEPFLVSDIFAKMDFSESVGILGVAYSQYKEHNLDDKQRLKAWNKALKILGALCLLCVSESYISQCSVLPSLENDTIVCVPVNDSKILQIVWTNIHGVCASFKENQKFEINTDQLNVFESTGTTIEPDNDFINNLYETLIFKKSECSLDQKLELICDEITIKRCNMKKPYVTIDNAIYQALKNKYDSSVENSYFRKICDGLGFIIISGDEATVFTERLNLINRSLETFSNYGPVQ